MKKAPLFALFISSVLLSSISGISCSPHKDVIKLTTSNFVDETSKGTVLVDFWATWCMPCKAMAPVIDEIASQTKGKLKVGKVDIDANGPLANQFRIQAIPTLIIFQDGKPVETMVGVQSKEAIIYALSRYINIQ
jgi:thioredoxin 1